MFPENDSDEESPFDDKGKEPEEKSRRSSRAFGATAAPRRRQLGEGSPASIGPFTAHNSEYSQEDNNRRKRKKDPFFNIPPPLNLGNSGPFGSASASSSSRPSGPIYYDGPFPWNIFPSSSSSSMNEKEELPEEASPLAVSSGSVIRPFEPRPNAREAMQIGAAALMDRRPIWIKSTILPDGLPGERSSTNRQGEDLETRDQREQEGAYNDFSRWLRSADPNATLPDARAAMNCWEAVCTSAYYGGLANKRGLRNLFQRTADAENPIEAFLNNFGRGNTGPGDPNTRPPRPGDIILMDNDQHIGFHVFIAGGLGKRFNMSRDVDEDIQYAYSHDRPDRVRRITYLEYDRMDPFPDSWRDKGKPSDASMVRRGIDDVIALTHQQYKRSYPAGRELQVRYLSPDVFKELPK